MTSGVLTLMAVVISILVSIVLQAPRDLSSRMVRRKIQSSDAAQRFDWLLLSDPGLIRLGFAVRATLAAMTAWFIGLLLVQHSGDPKLVTLPLIAGFVSFMAMTLVSDVSMTDQRRSTLLIGLPAIASMVLATMTSSVPWLNSLALLAVCFLAYFSRRFGPQFVGLGMMGLILFFFSSIMRIQPGQLPWMLGAVLVGIGCVYLFRFVLLPRNPGQSLRQSIIVFRRHASSLVGLLIEVAAERQWTPAKQKQVRYRTDQLRACIEAVETQLEAIASPTWQLTPELDQLSVDLFDATQSFIVLVEAVPRLVTAKISPPDEIWQEIVAALKSLQEILNLPTALRPECPLTSALGTLTECVKHYASVDRSPLWGFSVLRMEIAMRQLAELMAKIDPEQIPVNSFSRSKVPSPLSPIEALATNSEQPQTPNSTEPNSSEPNSTEPSSRLNPATVLAIQATIAGGLAMVIAPALSLGRPYWATLTAIVLISGSFGETLKRTVGRSLGTLGGAILGFALAAIAFRLPLVEVALLFVCVFFQTYTLRISYTWSIFWITAGLILLLTALGGFHRDIEVWRVADTVVGGAIGTVVAAVVLPTRTIDQVRSVIRDYLWQLDNLVRDAVSRLVDVPTPTNLSEAAHALSNQLDVITTALDSLKYESTVMGNFSRHLVQWLTPLRAATHYAMALSTNANQGKSTIDDQNLRDILTLAQTRIAANIEVMMTALRDEKHPQIEEMEDVHDRLRHAIDLQAVLAADSNSKTLQFVNCIYYLFRLNACLVNMTINLGGKAAVTSAPDRDQRARARESAA
jgi:uncharacterized membrane protein YccC